MTAAGACAAIRVDASSTIGLGHASRCLALANALVRRHCRVMMLTAVGLGCLTAKAESLGCEILRVGNQARRSPSAARPLPEAADAAASREALAAANVRPTWVVTDGYGFGSEWHRLLRQTAARILCIDERADRPLGCDLLVDPGLPADSARYDGLLMPHCRQFLGARLALLAPEYAALRNQAGVAAALPRRLVVSFGGSDHEPGTLAAAAALARQPADLIVVADVVVARSHPDRAAAGIVRMIEPEASDLTGSLTTAILGLLTGRETLAIDAGQRLCDGRGADRFADEVISWRDGRSGGEAWSSEGMIR